MPKGLYFWLSPERGRKLHPEEIKVYVRGVRDMHMWDIARARELRTRDVCDGIYFPCASNGIVLRIFTESAGTWVLFVFITYMVYVFSENASYIFLYLVCPRFYAREPLSTLRTFQGNQVPLLFN